MSSKRMAYLQILIMLPSISIASIPMTTKSGMPNPFSLSTNPFIDTSTPNLEEAEATNHIQQTEMLSSFYTDTYNNQIEHETIISSIISENNSSLFSVTNYHIMAAGRVTRDDTRRQESVFNYPTTPMEFQRNPSEKVLQENNNNDKSMDIEYPLSSSKTVQESTISYQSKAMEFEVNADKTVQKSTISYQSTTMKFPLSTSKRVQGHTVPYQSTEMDPQWSLVRAELESTTSYQSTVIEFASSPTKSASSPTKIADESTNNYQSTLMEFQTMTDLPGIYTKWEEIISSQTMLLEDTPQHSPRQETNINPQYSAIERTESAKTRIIDNNKSVTNSAIGLSSKGTLSAQISRSNHIPHNHFYVKQLQLGKIDYRSTGILNNLTKYETLSSIIGMSLNSSGNLTQPIVLIPDSKLEPTEIVNQISGIKNILLFYPNGEPIKFQDFNRNSTDIQLDYDTDLTDISPSVWYYNLTQTFSCTVLKNNGINISCSNISVYGLSDYLPTDTKSLSISNSLEYKLLKPLFPDLRNLTTLKLRHNGHQFITKAFVGLQNLESLDLSFNNIMVISKAFHHTPNLKSLDLSMNYIIRVGTISRALSHLQYFENLTLNHNSRIQRIHDNEIKPMKGKWKMLSLFNTTLNTIEQGAFKHLTSLKVLELSSNYMNEEALNNATNGIAKTIQYLFVRQLTLMENLPLESLTFLQNTSIYRLDLSYNYFLILPKFPNIPSLQSLWLSHCFLKTIAEGAFDEVPNLTELVLDNNDLITYPIGNASLNNLEILILKNQHPENRIYFTMPNFGLSRMKYLKILDVSSVLLGDALSRHSFHGLSALNVVSLSMARLHRIEDNSFETLSSLEILDLTRNTLTHLSNFTFYGLVNLTNLYLSENYLTLPDSISPFQHVPRLKFLLMHRNKIEKIPEGIFGCLCDLEMLVLAKNKLLPWKRKILNENTTLNTLGLSENQIDFVTSTMLDEFHQVDEYLDLTKNPLNCSKCGMVEFQLFLKSSNLTIGLPIPKTVEEFSFSCAEPKTLQNQPFLEVEIPTGYCEGDTGIFRLVVIIIIVFSIVILIGIVSYMCFTFRWYVRYLIFHVKSKVKEKTIHKRNRQNYTYDAFVSYNSHDTQWIVQHLIPALEPAYKLCVHERNFELGKLITENILESIESSRKVILILTEDFIKSEWCMFELHMAQHRLFNDTRDCLVLVKLKELDKSVYTKQLMYLEKTRLCLSWTESPMRQKIFWKNIKTALGAPIATSQYNEISV